MEAVNFDSTLFDVDDLSTIRGGGEAMLEAPAYVIGLLGKEIGDRGTIGTIRKAASKAVAQVTLGEIAPEDLGKSLDEILARFDPAEAQSALLQESGEAALPDLLKQLLPQLTFAWSLLPEGAPSEAAERDLRLAQLRRLSVDVPPAAARKGIGTFLPCAEDRIRPVGTSTIMPDASEIGGPSPVSWSVALRRKLGRTARRGEFYRRTIGDGGIELTLPKVRFANDFGELVESPPSSVPEQIAGKLAFVSIDANAMSGLRQSLVTGDGVPEWRGLSFSEREAKFAERFKKLRAEFLRDLLQWAAGEKQMLIEKDESEPVVRLETIIWGADEMAFVCPGWAFAPLVGKLSQLLSRDRWKLSESHDGVTHALGVVLSNHKAPLRLLRGLADRLANDAKTVSRDRSLLQYWVSGSIDMPTRTLAEEREALFGIPTGDNQARAFTLELGGAVSGLSAMRRVIGESGNARIGVPREKLAELVARECSSRSDDFTEEIKDLLIKWGYEDAGGSKLTVDDLLTNAMTGSSADNGERHAPVIHLLELWHYVALASGEDTLAGNA